MRFLLATLLLFAPLAMASGSKFIKNTTGADIDVAGVTIEPGEYFEITNNHAPQWSIREDVDAGLVSGDLVLARDNSGTTDITDLTEARRFLKNKWVFAISGTEESDDQIKVDFTGNVSGSVSGETLTVNISPNAPGALTHAFCEDNDTSSTTSNSWVTLMDTNDTDECDITGLAAGQYHLHATSEQTNSDSDKDTGWRVRVDSTTIGEQHQGPVDDELYMPRSTQTIVTLPARIRVDHGQTDQGGTARTRRIRLFFLRVGP